MSKNIFISQPMNGRTDAEILDERERMLELAARECHDIHPLETFFPDLGPDAKPLTYLAKSLEYLAKADVAVFAPGWQDARGCRIEHQCAADYGIPIMEV